MKNLLLTVAFIFVGSFAFANSSLNSLTLLETCSFNEIELNLDLGDLTNKTETEINNEIKEFLTRNLNSFDEELNCKVSVTGTVNVGVGSVKITVEVSGPCSEIRKSGTEIANMILAEIKKALK